MLDECTQCDETRRERDEAMRERNEERLMKLHALARLHARGPALAIGSDDFTWMVEQIYKLGDELTKLRDASASPSGTTHNEYCPKCHNELEVTIDSTIDNIETTRYIIDTGVLHCSECVRLVVEHIDDHLRM